ncbi:MAG: hypothetical protein C0500_06100 [Sphingobium sp.]|nr:hypothetical protein [Sphingobium sp.]
MVFDSLAATFYHNVVAAYDEYVEHRDSTSAGRDRHLRTAVNAAIALYHFREHLPDILRAPVKDLELTSPDYALMQGVTNASKHKQVTRRSPLVAGAEDITEAIVIVRYSDEDGEYSHAQTIINVTCSDGVTRWLDPAITRVLNFWGATLQDAGVCGYNIRSEPEEPGRRYLSRGEASIELNLEAMRGLDFRQTMQLLRFDHALGYAIPIDLTGADMQFRIYKPPQHIVDVTMSHPKHGDMTASITLTDEENIAFHHIQTQADQKAFMERLLKTRRSEIE